MKVKIIATQQIMELARVPRTTLDILILEGLLSGKEINFQSIKNLSLGQAQCIDTQAGFSLGFSIGFNS